MKRAVWFASLALFFVVGCGGMKSSGSSNADRSSPSDSEIRAAHDRYPQAWLEGDQEAVMKCFAEGAILIPHHGHLPVRGRAAIRRFFWPEDAEGFEIKRYELRPAEVSGSGDLAYVRGRFELILEMERDGRELASTGNYLMLLTRSERDRWMIDRFMWSDPPAISMGGSS